MRLIAWAGLVGILSLAPVPGAAASDGNFYARIRANDAPIGGRFSIYAYMLDSLDAAVELPGPGRILAINFREANGKDSFIVPRDLAVRDREHRHWNRGFFPLTEERLGGYLHKDQSRWAVWFLPLDKPDSLRWVKPSNIEILYGFSKSGFVPLDDKDAAALAAILPWDRIREVDWSENRSTADIRHKPNPASFDKPPRVREHKDPVYPKSSRMYSFEGTVHVVATVDVSGKVTDAFVIHSDTAHDLNVSALAAVMDWVFRPGTKAGTKVGGEIVIPMRFSLGSKP